MSRASIIAAAAAALCIASPAQAQDDYYTARGFVKACGSQNTSDPRLGICIGMVTGFIARDGMSYSTKVICRPSEVTNGQALAAVIQFSKAHPELSNSRIGNFLFLALSAAYPCPLGGVKR